VKDQELNPRPHTLRPAALPVKVEQWDQPPPAVRNPADLINLVPPVNLGLDNHAVTRSHQQLVVCLSHKCCRGRRQSVSGVLNVGSVWGEGGGENRCHGRTFKIPAEGHFPLLHFRECGPDCMFGKHPFVDSSQASWGGIRRGGGVGGSQAPGKA